VTVGPVLCYYLAQMFLNKKIKRTTLICIFLGLLLIGLFISKFTSPISITWLILVAVLFPIAFGRWYFLLIYIIFAGLILGWWRGGLLQTQHAGYQKYFGQKVEVVGRATEDSTYTNQSQIQFAVESVQINGTKLPGKIQIKGFGEAMVYRHDVVKASGKLYPTLGGKQAGVSFSSIDVLARSKSSIDDFRRNFIAGMESALPEPAASFAVGLLVGQRSLLPSDVATVLTIVGLTHVVAVSGYNLTIIIRAVQSALKRFSRFQVLAISLALIYLFILVTGYSPSIIRATIVSVFSLIAWYFGRSFRPILLILMAASITGFANPYYIWNDIGWYLSFLAFFGVLILAPLLTARIFGNRKIPLLGAVAIESFSAQIMTLPVIMLIFGRISVIGLLANIIIVPLVPLGMLLSLIAGVGGMLVPVVAGWLALPARILLNIMLWLAAWFSKWPSAQIMAKISPGSLITLYLIIGVFLIGLKKRLQSIRASEFVKRN
jgi:competence protein ComEC